MPAWKPVVAALEAQARATPGFLASLYFDLACTDEALWPVWQEFMETRPAWCALHVVDGSPLFHVKAVAARGPAGVQVFIGSANLTKAGLHSNFEIMAGAHQDPATFDALEAALAGLGGRATRLCSSEDVAAAAKRAEGKRRAVAGALEDEGRGGRLEGPAREVAELLASGVFVYRSEEELHLTVSVSMDVYRKAGVLRPLRSNALATGITWGDRADTMLISLVPEEIDKQCREVRKKCGKIVGRLALSTAGRLWMPRTWAGTFRDRWKQAAFQGQDVPDRVREHVEELMRQIKEGKLLSEKRGQLYQILDVQPVSSWNLTSISSDTELLGARLATLHLFTKATWAAVRAVPPSTLVSDRLRAEVVEGVMDYISHMTRSQLTVEFPLLQIQALRTPPALVPVGGIGPAELIQAMAEWARRAATPHLRLAVGRTPTNGVAAALYACLQRNGGGNVAAHMYARAIEWQSKLSSLCEASGPATAESIGRLATNAATEFQAWFTGLDWGNPPGDDDDDGGDGAALPR